MGKRMGVVAQGRDVRFFGRALAVVAGVLLCVGGLYLATRETAYKGWRRSPAQVLGTRVSTVGLRPSGEARPGEVLYQGEAHVLYMANGARYDAWLASTPRADDRAWLVFTMSKQVSGSAEVEWDPGDPARAHVVMSH